MHQTQLSTLPAFFLPTYLRTRGYTVGWCSYSRFEALSACIRPYVAWTRCMTDLGDSDDRTPLASAARRFAVSRRLRDWAALVHQLDIECADDSRPPGTSAGRCFICPSTGTIW